MSHVTENDFTYLVCPGDPSHLAAERVEIYDKIYDFWNQFWARFYNDAHSSEKLKAEDFIRSHFVTAVFKGGEICGILLLSKFELSSRATWGHSYIHKFPEEVLRGIQQEGVNSLLSMEFLAVAPAYRKSVGGVSVAEILVGCGCRLVEISGVQASFANARVDVKVPEITSHYGFKTRGDKYLRHNFEVSVIYCPRSELKEHESPVMKAMVEKCWQERRDYTEYAKVTPIFYKKAA